MNTSKGSALYDCVQRDAAGRPLLSQQFQEAANAEEIRALAFEIMSEARASLAMAFRFLDTALWRMPVKPAAVLYALATNGKELRINPAMVDLRFVMGFNELVRDYLHVLLHCVFRHPFDESHDDVQAWSLACDIVIEAIALEMCDRRYACSDDVRRKEALTKLEGQVGTLTIEKLYRHFKGAFDWQTSRDAACTQSEALRLNSLFLRDSHEFWACMGRNADQDDGPKIEAVRTRNLSDPDETPHEEKPRKKPAAQKDELPEDDSDQPDQPEQPDESEQEENPVEHEEIPAFKSLSDEGAVIERSAKDEQDDAAQAESEEEARAAENQDGAAGADEDDGEDDSESIDETSWEEISKQIQMDLDTFSKKQGLDSGTLMANLELVNRKQIDYTSFLRQFATMGEDLKINDDEFDYIFYTYGLDLYGNMPLVEPLEYKEDTRVREFVIAIDTSGSCSGELVTRFVNHTYQILRETQGFGSEVNVHIIQCDSKIQMDEKLTSLADLQKYCDNFQALGFGGTDFRPVFDYVAQLCSEGEFTNLRGLIYFTDGQGIFPEVPPPYETAFVFVDNDGAQSVPVPPWAMRVVMTQEKIERLNYYAGENEG